MLKIKIFCKSRIFIYGKSYVKNHSTFVTIFAPKLFRFLFSEASNIGIPKIEFKIIFRKSIIFIFRKICKKNPATFLTIFAPKLFRFLSLRAKRAILAFPKWNSKSFFANHIFEKKLCL